MIEPSQAIAERLPPLWDDPAIVDATAASLPAASSARLYRRDVLAFVRELQEAAGVAPLRATLDDLLTWWNAVRRTPNGAGHEPKPATVNRKVGAVRRFYRETALRGLVPRDVAVALPYLPVSKEPQGRALAKDEARTLLSACPQDGTLLDFRDLCVVAFLLSTGCRASEVAAVTVEDLRIEEGRRVVGLHRKGGRQTLERVAGPLGTLLDAWQLRAAVHEGALLRAIVRVDGAEVARPGHLDRRTIHRIVSDRAAAAGLGKGVGPHDLRRTWVTAATDLDPNLLRVARAAGHADPATTMRYAHQREFFSDNPNDRVGGWLWG